MLSPLQLRQHSLLEVSLKECEASPNDPSSNWIPDEPEIKADFASAVDDPYLSRILLTLKSKDLSPGVSVSAWEFKIRVSGVFEFTDKATPIDMAKKLTFVNGTSMLYGMARDILQSISLRGQKPSILLPSLNFQFLAKQFDPPDLDNSSLHKKSAGRKSVGSGALVASEPKPKLVKKPKPSTKGKSKK